ncbi:Uu.00g124490.m01.CDS01 [Anthostomella pinea]|uniref:Uu.00g124490.m01.CDS01 n=1 Tax=Anthostomella pinea TaxID=933095 RepID=A0AAI8YHH9_9PEZI|nr:Uu.00g124490.m01.CDS01 [Anthostomella pinea]
MESFQQDRLPSPNHFRILTLHPGITTAPLRGSLAVHELTAPPAYEAISYAWGPTTPTALLECSGRALRITGSLDTALRAFRWGDRPRELWIDQICINQHDTDERSQQVQRMRDIYSQANRVLSWLGEDDGSARGPLAKDLIAKICAVVRRHQVYREKRFPPEEYLRVHGLPLWDDPSWCAMGDMLQLPYFKRAWVIQEIVMAREASLLWGATQINWELFRVAFYWTALSSCGAQYLENGKMSPMLGFLPSLYRGRLRPSTLEEIMLTDARWFEATDPRDKVYALIGLADDGGAISVDYRKSAAQVYADAARYVIRGSRSLRVLSLVNAINTDHIDFPTWTPRWDTRCDRAYLWLRKFTASGSSQAVHVEDGASWRTLTLKGVKKGVLRHICSTSVPNRYKGASPTLLLLKELFDELCTKSGAARKRCDGSLLNVFLRCLVMERDTEEAVPTGLLFAKFISWAWTKLAQECTNISRASAARAQRNDFAACYAALEFIQLALDTSPSLSDAPPDESTVVQETQHWVRVVVDALVLASGNPSLRSDLGDCVIRIWSRQRCDDFNVKFEVVGSYFERFFVAENGEIGVGPACLQTNDILCILYGGSTPYILRPTSTPGEYLFLGECYVAGIMNGERLDGIDVDTTAEWFHLR